VGEHRQREANEAAEPTAIAYPQHPGILLSNATSRRATGKVRCPWDATGSYYLADEVKRRSEVEYGLRSGRG
jgi:hypothetical protein